MPCSDTAHERQVQADSSSSWAGWGMSCDAAGELGQFQGWTVSPRGIRGAPQTRAALSLNTTRGCVSAQRMSRDQQAGSSSSVGWELPHELLKSGRDAESFPQSQEKNSNPRKGWTGPPFPGRPLGVLARLLALAGPREISGRIYHY